MASVFDKFDGIRPMAAKLGGLPPSTVKSWHTKRCIPDWRHAQILAAAVEHGIALSRDELVNIRADRRTPPKARKTNARKPQTQGRAA